MPEKTEFGFPRFEVAAAVGIGAVLCGLGALGGIDGSGSRFASAPFFALGGLVLMIAALGFSYRRTVSLSRDGVRCRWSLAGFSREWHLPYCAYAGVLLTTHVTRSENRSEVLQVIELHHLRRSYCLPLFVQYGYEVPRERQEAYARRLELPALMQSDGVLTARAHDELDLSLAERLRRSSAQKRPAELGAPPFGLRLIESEPGAPRCTRVRIRTPRIPAIGYLGVVAMCVLFIGIASSGPWYGPLVAYAFTAGWMGLLARDLCSVREVRIDGKAVSVLDEWPHVAMPQELDALEFEEIEDLRLVRDALHHRRTLVIEGDRGKIRVGAGLSRRSLRWLQQFIAATIADRLDS